MSAKQNGAATSTSVQEALAIPHHRVQWRVGSTFKKGSKLYGQLLAYVDARTVMERLDILDPEWSMRHGLPFQMGDQWGVPGELTVRGVTRTDVGVASDMEPIKGAYSDALKRCAVHFGIGRELYEMPFVAVEVEEKANGKAGKPLALPTYNAETGLWEIDREYGFIRYSEVSDGTETSTKTTTRKSSTVKPRGAGSGEEITDKQRQMLFGKAKKVLSVPEFRSLVFIATGKRSAKQLRQGDVDTMLEALENEEMLEKARRAAASAEDRVPVVTP